MKDIRNIVNLPEGWNTTVETVDGPEGEQIHIESASNDGRTVELWLGPMPVDSTAPDQALTNYVDMVGFDDDDPEDFNPIEQWEFKGRKAFGFEVYCDDESMIRVMCLEYRKKQLCVASVIAANENAIADTVAFLEKSIRI